MRLDACAFMYAVYLVSQEKLDILLWQGGISRGGRGGGGSTRALGGNRADTIKL